MTSDAPAGEQAREPAEELPVLAFPAEGLPDLVTDQPGLEAAVAALLAGEGPVAVDTERAQGFRYSGRAYLIQLRRTGSGTHLIDPVAFSDPEGVAHLDALQRAIGPQEWILHAASQDLPCLVEAGLVPARLFDTELAGRLLGLPKVGLGALVEQFFGQRLLKEHSAADWSRRPLPEEWLVYAALDVELLVPLRDTLEQLLVDAGKDEWARQEFAHTLRTFSAPRVERGERWRRTAGIHDVHSRRGMAIVRELWMERDEIAERLDRAPGRTLGDAAITQLAALASDKTPKPLGRDELRAIPLFARRPARQYENNWLAALQRALDIPVAHLPKLRVVPDGPPPPRSWPHRNPDAAARWEAARPAANRRAEELELPAENLVSPDTLRRLCWEVEVPANASAAELGRMLEAELLARGARPWQAKELAPALGAALAGGGSDAPSDHTTAAEGDQVDPAGR
ncbi:MAG TPA: HRDC domain-containing protein [Propionibacteriaceae bacterium]|nr:HRDC domain-containing protein [Propionibacteriaceae bacterium]